MHAAIEREAEAAHRQDEEEEIQHHSRTLCGFLGCCGSSKIKKVVQIRATFAVPGDQSIAALQAEQVPLMDCEIELKAITTRVHSEPLMRLSLLQVGHAT